jgi:hypothetical protein
MLVTYLEGTVKCHVRADQLLSSFGRYYVRSRYRLFTSFFFYFNDLGNLIPVILTQFISFSATYEISRLYVYTFRLIIL